jgi:hypothetical protein
LKPFSDTLARRKHFLAGASTPQSIRAHRIFEMNVTATISSLRHRRHDGSISAVPPAPTFCRQLAGERASR